MLYGKIEWWSTKKDLRGRGYGFIYVTDPKTRILTRYFALGSHLISDIIPKGGEWVEFEEGAKPTDPTKYAEAQHIRVLAADEVKALTASHESGIRALGSNSNGSRV